MKPPCATCRLEANEGRLEGRGANTCNHLAPEPVDRPAGSCRDGHTLRHDEGVCSCCPVCPSCSSHWADPTQPGALKLERTVSMFTHQKHVKQPFSIYSLRCSNETCTTRLPYDGIADGIFVPASGSVVYSLDMMMGYVHALDGGSVSYRGYHNTIAATYKNVNEEPPPWTSFLRVLQSFLRLYLSQLDRNRLFCCPVCKLLPDNKQIRVFDGVTLGIRRNKFYVLEQPFNDLGVHEAVTLANSATVVISAARKLLRKLGDAPGITEAEMKALDKLALDGQGNYNRQGAFLLLQHLKADSVVTLKDKMWRVPTKDSRDLIRCLTMEQPVSGLWHSTSDLSSDQLLDILDLKGGLAESPLSKLRWSFSQLYYHIIAQRSNVNGFRITPSLRSLMVFVVQRSSIADEQPATPGTFIAPPPIDPYSRHMIAPTRPLIRLPAKYQTDKYQCLGSQGVSSKTAADTEGSVRCTKVALKHKIFTPGIMHASCPHGITELAYMMPRYEGPTLAFEILYTRYSVAPKMVVYDNACNLHVSCTRRESRFFCDTKFLSDRLHWADHNNCSNGYSMNSLPSNMELIPSIDGFPPLTVEQFNTQVSEQLNRKLQGVRTQMSYMSHDNFYNFFTLFLAMNNEKKIEALYKSRKTSDS